MQESAIYQEIYHAGELKGELKGKLNLVPIMKLIYFLPFLVL